MAEVEYRLPFKVLSIALLLAFSMWLPLFSVPAIEDFIRFQLEISHLQMALLYSLPVAVLALVAIPAGFLADWIGLKKMIGIGVTLLAVGAALRGTTHDYSLMLFFTLVYGLGLGLCFPNLPKLARHCSLREKLNVLIGGFTVAILVAGAISYTIAGPLLYQLTGSFDAVFLWNSVPAAVTAVLWWLLIGEPPCEAAGVETVVFDARALRKLLRRTDLWLVASLFFVHNIFIYTWVGWLPGFMVSIGASESLAGAITSVVLWAGATSVISLARLSARLGRRKPFLWISSILLVFICFGMIYVNLPLSWVLMIISGVATSIRFSTILSLPVEMVTPGQSGSASGMMMSIGYIGALLGPIAAGLILDATGSYDGVFLMLAAVSLVTVVVSFMIPETGMVTAQ